MIAIEKKKDYFYSEKAKKIILFDHEMTLTSTQNRNQITEKSLSIVPYQ